MKVMISAFALAIVIAVGAGYLLNSSYQMTADARFVGSGAQLRHNEAGSNLVGKDWSGLNRQSSAH
jgi:Na+(H+)/acetate symporter ActP